MKIKKRTTISISGDTHKRLKKEAIMSGRSISSLADDAVNKGVRHIATDRIVKNKMRG